jgi:plasmid stability protein
MPTLTIRNVPEPTQQALKVRALKAHRSMEAEVRAILEATVRPESRPRLGTLLAEIGRQAGGVDLDISRSAESSEPVDFS